MRYLLMGARLLSSVFRPEFFPLLGFVVLFWFTYMSLLPWSLKGIILLLVLCGTILFPRLTIRFWRQSRGWERHRLRLRENRFMPYLTYLLYYVFTLHVLNRFHLPHYMSGILVGALIIQGSCALINHWWKISVHCAGAGGVIGALAAYSLIFLFNPLGWLCLCILVAGLVGSSRMLLRQHDLWQVLAGTLVGVVGGFAGIILS
jgi:membrane-associated phospholipid phosphatase